MLRRALGISFLIGLTVIAVPSAAQQPSASRPAVPMFSLSDNAQFLRVDEGIFEIQVGRTIDLTDKKLTFMISRIENIDQPAHSIVSFRIGGDSYSLEMGGRFDIRRHREKDLREYKFCYLDLIRVTEARGAPPSATFRLECR